MKKTTTIILSLVYAFTLATPMVSAAAENSSKGGDLLMAAYETSNEIIENDNEEIEQQCENNLIYTEITEAYSDSTETISFDYAGGYINENNELVICVAEKDLENEEIVNEIESICSTDISNVVIEKVNYSYDELKQTRIDFENNLEKYKKQAEIENDMNLYELLSSITSNEIDDELNKLIIYVPELDSEKLALLNELFDFNDIISFESSYTDDFELCSTLRPGRAIYGWTKNNEYVYASIGYRALYKAGLKTYYGFCTAGHFVEDFDGVRYVYGDDGSSAGQVMINETYDNVDAAFINVFTGWNTFQNNYISGGNTYSFCSNKWFTYLPKNATVYKVGATTGLTKGTVKSTDASTLADGIWLSGLVKTSAEAKPGDSGGLVFAYENGDGHGGYIAAGLVVSRNVWGDTYYSKCTSVANKLNVFPY